MFALLASHALIAWTLRTRPGLSWKMNPVFPAWAALSVGCGMPVTTSPIGGILRVTPMTGNQPGLATIVIVLRVLLAAAPRPLSASTPRL